MKRNRNNQDKCYRFSFEISVSKNLLKQILLLFILAALFFGVNFYNRLDVQKQFQSAFSPKEANANNGLPVSLKIPKINVNANIQYVGVDANNVMEAPSTGADVGWFKLGPKPGEKGSAIINGHVDSESGEEGVFSNLHKLTKGDKLYIQDDNGKSLIFIVSDTRVYNEGAYAADVFDQTDGIRLNLITCDGVWDGVKKSYTQRLVVFSNIEPLN